MPTRRGARSVPSRALSFLFLALVAIACSPSTSESPAANGDGLTGDIQVSGSSTVRPISDLVFEAFTAMHPGVTGFVDGPGTTAGFELFCAGETDLQDASRAIKDEEAAICEENGVEYVELKVGIDGMSVITSAFNDEIDCLSLLDLYALIGPESQNFDTWADANDLAAELEAEVGADHGESHAPYPDEALIITAPGEESGTFDSFVELAIQKIADEREQERTTRPDYQSSSDDNQIIEGVAGSEDAPFTLGWVGYAYAAENADRVSLVAVDKGDGCTAADPETISSAEYPLARFLFIYANLASAADEPTVEAFVDFYLSDAGMAFVPQADYIALAEDDLAASRAAWNGH